MSADRYLWPLLRARPGLYLLSCLLSVAYSCLPLLIGLIVRAFFDALTGGASIQFHTVQFEAGTLIWLFLAATLTAQLSTQVYAATNVYFYGALGALLRRNLVEGMLEGSGRRQQESAGEIIDRFDNDVVTGRIGAGKSTLLKALLGLSPETSGLLRWNGERVQDPARFMLPPRCGYVSQVPRLFSDTLRENILLGLCEEQVDLQAALSAAVLEADLQRLEKGLDTLVGPRGVRLSGGQVQRTAVARALVRQPELLLVDDLSSALDVETEQQLWERLLARRGGTCLAVSHRRAVLRRADWIVVLREGKVQAQGRLEELLTACEEMRWLWQEESKE